MRGEDGLVVATTRRGDREFVGHRDILVRRETGSTRVAPKVVAMNSCGGGGQAFIQV